MKNVAKTELLKSKKDVKQYLYKTRIKLRFVKFDYKSKRMLKNSLLLCLLLSVPTKLVANLSLEGTYQGKNLYVLNPEDESGFGYCTRKVTVNGDVLPSSIGTRAFEIDFSLFQLQIGDPVFIVIEHTLNCKPKVINPEVLLPRSTFKVLEMSVSETGKLVWKTQNENGKLPFFIEQYRWNKWVQIGEVNGKGTNTINTYEFQVLPHAGKNTVRVVQIDHSGEKKASNEVSFESETKEVSFGPLKVRDFIRFTSDGKAVETKYEIFDAYGNIVKKGFGESVDCKNLVKGVYYINFDNKVDKFLKG